MTERPFEYRETQLTGGALLRDVAPALVITLAAFILHAWLPVERDTGLRPVEASELVIVGTLAASIWIVVRRLLRSARRVLSIGPEAICIHPPQGLLALPGKRGEPEWTLDAGQIVSIRSTPLPGLAGSWIRRRHLGDPHLVTIRTGNDSFSFSEVDWQPDVDTSARLATIRNAGRVYPVARLSLREGLQAAGYRIED